MTVCGSLNQMKDKKNKWTSQIAVINKMTPSPNKKTNQKQNCKLPLPKADADEGWFTDLCVHKPWKWMRLKGNKIKSLDLDYLFLSSMLSLP